MHRIGRAASASSRLLLGIVVALLPLREFRFPSRKEALVRIDRISGLASHPAAVIDDRLGNGANDPATRALWNLHRRRAEQAVALLRTGGPSPRMVDLDRYALRASVLVALIATGFVAGPEKYARVAAAFRLALRRHAEQWLPGGRLDRSSRLHGKTAARFEPRREHRPYRSRKPAKNRGAKRFDRRHSRAGGQSRHGRQRRPRRRPRRRKPLPLKQAHRSSASTAKPMPERRAVKTKSGWFCAATRRSPLAAPAGRSARSIFMPFWTCRRRSPSRPCLSSMRADR